MIEPTTSAETLTILKNIKFKYEDHHKVRYDLKALEACVNLSEDISMTDNCQIKPLMHWMRQGQEHT